MSVNLVNTANVFDSSSASLAISGATGVAFAYVAGTPYLYVSGQNDGGISAFSVNAAGQLSNVTSPGGNVRDTDSGFLAIGGASGLATLSIGSSSFLYATGQSEGGMSAFALGQTGVMVNPAGALGNVHDTDVASYELSGAFGVIGATVGGNSYVIAAGLTDNGISSFSVDPLTGAFTHVADFNLDDGVYTNFKLAGAAELTSAVVGGTTYVIAAGQVDDGLTIFSLDAAGALDYHASVSDDATQYLDGVSAVTTALVGSSTYIFAAGISDHGLSVYRLAPGGVAANVFNLGDTATSHLYGIYGLTTANIAGTTYLFTADYYENAVSVFAVAADGSLVDMGSIVDNATFAVNGPLLMATAVIGGNTFLAATGFNDGGVSLFRVDTTGLTITGTAGADIIDATHAPAGQLLPSELGDAIFGLAGNDLLAGLGGDDTLDGGDGNDALDGGAGTDTLRGGTGNDTYLLGNGADLVQDTGGTADRVTTTITRSLLAPGLATIERLTLISGNINGTGNNLGNIVTGSTGNNILMGGRGNDTLFGGAGNDTLFGEAGIDRLSGGAGKDNFVFNVAPTFANRDTITDFSHRDDTIKLAHSFFKGMGTGSLKSQFFFAGSHAHDGDDHIIYNKAAGALYYDNDGDGAHAQVLFAVVANHASAGLASSDFVLV